MEAIFKACVCCSCSSVENAIYLEWYGAITSLFSVLKRFKKKNSFFQSYVSMHRMIHRVFFKSNSIQFDFWFISQPDISSVYKLPPEHKRLLFLHWPFSIDILSANRDPFKYIRTKLNVLSILFLYTGSFDLNRDFLNELRARGLFEEFHIYFYPSFGHFD